jgi:hypothetical protein
MKLSLELLCGSSDVDPGHPGFFDHTKGNVHPKHAELEVWAKENGMASFVEPTIQDGTWYSDAYLYFDPGQIEDVAKKLKDIDFSGDILDVKETLTKSERKLVMRVADRESWAVNE